MRVGIPPPRRLLLVNNSEKENGSATFSLFPSSARFFPSVQLRCDCRRPTWRREGVGAKLKS